MSIVISVSYIETSPLSIVLEIFIGSKAVNLSIVLTTWNIIEKPCWNHKYINFRHINRCIWQVHWVLICLDIDEWDRHNKYYQEYFMWIWTMNGSWPEWSEWFDILQIILCEIWIFCVTIWTVYTTEKPIGMQMIAQ